MKKLYIFWIFITIPTLIFSQATVLDADFENANTIFNSSSSNGSGTPWQRTSSLSHTGTFSDSNKVQMGDTLYLTSPSFSTMHLQDLSLSFYHIAKISLSDKLMIELSSDSGNTWVSLDSSYYKGTAFMVSDTFFSSLSYSVWAPANDAAVPNNTWWKEEKFDISSIANYPHAQIRFALIDGDNNGDRGNYGWLLDDLSITTKGIASIHKQTLLFEDFNSGIPTTWTNTAVSGSFDWMHGSIYADEYLFSQYITLDSTPMVYFNDDSLGSSHMDNTIELISPIVPPKQKTFLFLNFDFNYRDLFNGSDTFKVEIYDGNNWINVLYLNKDNCGRWNPLVCGDYSNIDIDISNYLNDSLQVKFTYHDGNDWSYWIAFDNVHIYVQDEYHSIGEINSIDSVGIVDSLYMRTWTSGTVAGIDLDSNNGYSFTLIDHSTGNPEGISIYSIDDLDNYIVNEGDSLMIRGVVDQSYGLQQFVADSIVLLDSNKSLPTYRNVNILNESTESQLIGLSNFSVVAIDSINGVVMIASGTDTVQVRIEAATELSVSDFTIGKNLCFIEGIGSQKDTSAPYLEGYYFIPMNLDKINVSAQPINLGNDTVICSPLNIVLDAGSGFVSYKWNTGDTTQVIVPTSSTRHYSIVAEDSNNCISKDSIHMIVSMTEELDLGNNSIVCSTTNFKLDAGVGFKSYTWNTGDTTQKITALLSNTEYSVLVTDSFGCSSSDSIYIVFAQCKPNYYLFEDFNSGLPSNWSNSNVSGNFSWIHGKMFDFTFQQYVSFDNSDMIYFSDDFLGSTQINNTTELTSPIISPISNIPLFLEFDFNYRDRTNLAEFFQVQVYNGSNWISVFDQDTNVCDAWYPYCQPYPHARIDISDYINDSLQVKFVYDDGNGRGYWAAFDNVSIYNQAGYYPISTINTVNSAGIVDSLNLMGWTSGTVVGMDLDTGTGYAFTLISLPNGMQEGISIFSHEQLYNYEVNEGDSLLVYGYVKQTNALQQFVPAFLKVLGKNKQLPENEIVNEMNEGTESKLVELLNLKVVNVDPAGNFVDVAHGNDSSRVTIEEGTDVGQIAFTVGDTICSIKGIGTQVDSILPFFDGYSIVPMKVGDVVFGISPQINLGNDTLVCTSANFSLDAGPGFSSYSWNTGDTSQSIQVSQNDSLYILTAIDAYGCKAIDSILVRVDVCAALNENVLKASLDIYPNPSKGIFIIEGSNLQSDTELRLMDYRGKLIRSFQLKHGSSFKKEMDFSSLPKGLYFIGIANKNLFEVRKIVLQ